MSPSWRQSPFALYTVFLPDTLNIPKDYLLEVKGIDSKNKTTIFFIFISNIHTNKIGYLFTYLANKCLLRYILGKHYWNARAHTHTHYAIFLRIYFPNWKQQIKLSIFKDSPVRFEHSLNYSFILQYVYWTIFLSMSLTRQSGKIKRDNVYESC